MEGKCTSAFVFLGWCRKRKRIYNSVSLIDIFPTCLDYSKLEASHALDGHSLKPLLENPSKGQWEGDDFSLSACGSQVKSELHQPALAKTNISVFVQSNTAIFVAGEEELYDHYQILMNGII